MTNKTKLYQAAEAGHTITNFIGDIGSEFKVQWHQELTFEVFAFDLVFELFCFEELSYYGK